jgi:riboflavin synthase
MFTGLIEATGRVERADDAASGRRLRVGTALGADLATGDSIAVNGVCLTVADRDAGGFEADVSPETLRVTTLGGVDKGRVVNLERPLRADARLGGHFVLGHVDGVGVVRDLKADGDCYWLDVDLPSHVRSWVIPKGSIAVDGISLTVARLDGERVGIQIVPHTWAQTALQSAKPGDRVNIEADVIGKYVARLMGRETGMAGAVAEQAGMAWRRAD